MYIDKYPQTGTFADPETHPLRAFVPFLPRAVLALGPLFFCISERIACFCTYLKRKHVDTRVQSATEWTASVHTLHMSKPVM